LHALLAASIGRRATHVLALDEGRRLLLEL
jgi:hypothetical protein